MARPRLYFLVIALLLASGSTEATRAATPQTTKAQGLLTDRSSGTPVPAQGQFSMTFVLWDSLLGGATIRTVGPLPVQVAQGLFEAELPLSADDFAGTERYLEIVVNGETLTPRIRLVSTPFAFQAETTSTASTAGTASVALQVAPGSVGTAALAPGAVTADKLGIPCVPGQTLVRGATGWECTALQAPTICQQGSFVRCYTGPAGTLDIGACRSGTSHCNPAGTAFGTCTGEVLPQPETCDGIDNDCNGLVDDGLGNTTCGVGTCARTIANCVSGVPQTCQPQPNGTPCDDGAFCTLGDACNAGSCIGLPRDCSDSLPCTSDACDEQGDTCVNVCSGPTQFCASGSDLVICTGVGPTCGESHTTCPFGCNAGTNACNGCTPINCAYGCDASGEACFFPDTCIAPYPINGLDFGPALFTDDMSNYGPDVAGSCGAAGDDVIHQVIIPTSGGLTAFSTIMVDSTASTGIDTASHLTRVCGSAAAEPQYASSVCGASIGAGATCANAVGTDEILRACGMPSGTYFATLDSTVSTGAFTLSITVDNVDLDTCVQAGNVSNLPASPTTFLNTTAGKSANYVYDQTSSALGACPINQRNACGLGNGDPTGNVAACGSDGGSLGEDIVFYYRAAASGFLTVDTEGSDFDTILYIKNACNLTCAAPTDCLRCNDDHNFSAGDSWSRIYRLPVSAGALYFIVVDGYGGAAGSVQLNVSFSSQ